MKSNLLQRPYLVVPKLIEQPTWGGDYIVKTKGWQDRPELRGKKIGQSYELFSGSNLSLLTSSDDPGFMGELHNRDSVQLPSSVPNSVPLAQLVRESPEGALGQGIVKRRGPNIDLLIKFTQALGNSFQVHLRDGQNDPRWKSKPESWYFFEPGLITLGVKRGVKWEDYQAALEAVHAGMQEMSRRIKSGEITYEQAQSAVKQLIDQYNPWQFVNLVEVPKDGVVDASAGGLHHSWEEDTQRLPHGNVLYELQTEAMDDVSTLRSFDRGKMGADGSLREVHIADYFRLIDRSPEANDPARHVSWPESVHVENNYAMATLFTTSHYRLDKLIFKAAGAQRVEHAAQFVHLFVKSGRITVAAGGQQVAAGTGHSCFVPAAAGEYEIVCKSPSAEVLMSK